MPNFTFHFLAIILLSGCTGLKVQCESVNEAQLGEYYANTYMDTRNFEMFKNQCSKYGYRTPSEIEFKSAYEQTRASACINSRVYFKSSYKAYNHGATPFPCAESTPVFSSAESIRKDAHDAHTYKMRLDYIDDRQKNGSNIHSTSNDFILISLLRLLLEESPYTLEKDQQEIMPKLKDITKKYALFISELN